MARSGGRYVRSLELLDRSRRYRSEIATKTGIMVGLGKSAQRSWRCSTTFGAWASRF